MKMPRLFLGNLGHDCRQRDIEKIFRGYGELKNINIKVCLDVFTSYSRNRILLGSISFRVNMGSWKLKIEMMQKTPSRT